MTPEQWARNYARYVLLINLALAAAFTVIGVLTTRDGLAILVLGISALYIGAELRVKE